MKREAFRVLSGAALAICLIAVPPATAAKAAAVPTAYAPQLTRYPYLTDVAGGGSHDQLGDRSVERVGLRDLGSGGLESCTARARAPARPRSGSARPPNTSGRPAYPPTGYDYCYRVYLGPTGSDLDLLGSNPSPQFATASRRPDYSIQVRGPRRLGLHHLQRQPRSGELLDRLASSGARFALSTGDIAYKSGTQTNYGDLFQPEPRSTRSSVQRSGLGRRLDPMYRIMETRLERELPAGLAGRLGGRRLQWTLPDRQLLLSERDGVGEVPERLVRVRRGARAVLHAGRRLGGLQPRHGSVYGNDFDYHWSPASPEYQWLEHDLATHPAQVKFATFHFPLYSANATETSDAFLHGPNSLEGLLSRYGVDIAFNGHAHIYERNNANGPGGLISYVTGGGGAPLEPVTSAASFPASSPTRSAGRIPRPRAAPVAARLGPFRRVRSSTSCSSASLGTRSPSPRRTRWDEPSTAGPTISTRRSAARHHASQPAGNLDATAVNSGRVDLSWSQATDNVGVTGYKIYRDGALLTTTLASATSYSDTSALGGTTYQYTARAVDAAGNASDPSPAATLTTPSDGSVAASFVRDATGAVDSGTSSMRRSPRPRETRWSPRSPCRPGQPTR